MNKYVAKFEDIQFQQQKPTENEPLELAKICHKSTKECALMCKEEGEMECAVSCEESTLVLELYIFTIENDTKSHKEVAEITHGIVSNTIETCQSNGVSHCVEDCQNFAEELKRHLQQDY